MNLLPWNGISSTTIGLKDEEMIETETLVDAGIVSEEVVVEEVAEIASPETQCMKTVIDDIMTTVLEVDMMTGREGMRETAMAVVEEEEEEEEVIVTETETLAGVTEMNPGVETVCTVVEIGVMEEEEETVVTPTEEKRVTGGEMEGDTEMTETLGTVMEDEEMEEEEMGTGMVGLTGEMTTQEEEIALVEVVGMTTPHGKIGIAAAWEVVEDMVAVKGGPTGMNLEVVPVTRIRTVSPLFYFIQFLMK